MKKYTLYIFIIITLVGLFGSIARVSAQTSTSDPTGTCTYSNPTSVYPNSTLSECNQTPGTTFSPDGTCYVDGQILPGNWQQVNCMQQGPPVSPGHSARWAAGPPALGTCSLGGQIFSSSDTETDCTNNNKGATWTPFYNFLAPLPNPNANGTPLTSFDATQANNLGTYLNLMITIFIGICAVLAVIMIFMGGIEYMTSELPGGKSDGKDKIWNAVFGLLLAIGAWLILFTINPDILKTDLSSLQTVSVASAGGLTQAQQIANFSGTGTCTPVSDSSSPCSTANLTSWGFVGGAQQASSICNGESGGQADAESKVDITNDNQAFSFGLFQVNAVAHANDIVDKSTNPPTYPCQGVFIKNGTGTQGNCLLYDAKTGKVCVKYDVTVDNQQQYDKCAAFLENPTNNIAYAANLLDNNNWNQWGANASCHF